ncbi:MAG TPA: protein kinase [Thermoanaerobaculia bacterium]|jgi:Tol biopolymer transport system component
MTLQAGSRLGPYEITGLLGAGGMGEVYRATDPRLGRDVAVKVLPASLSQDADRLKRFEQEARAAGVLNHPNITAVYDLGTNASDGAPYIVTELLEGETLRSRLSTGALSVRKATDYAMQIAKGLAAAHEKGIVHRDLKPENLFITRDGRLKILDFGLAKLKSEKDGEQTDLKTVSGTEPGVVLGTMGYMSPEQVRGKPADRRSDLFSVGTILYEMLSGQRAFRGETAADTITAILTKEPPDLSTTNKDIHPGLDRILRHCLEKNPEERFESARDLAFDLEALSGVSGSTTGAVAAAASAETRPRTRWTGAVFAAILLALAAGVAGGLLAGRRMTERSPVSFRQLSFRRGPIYSARFAPDGETVIYTAAWDGRPMELFTTRLDTPESRSFGLTGAEVLSISSAGEMAVSLSRRTQSGFTRVGTLSRIGMTGGSAPKDIRDDVIYADWAPDGKDLAIVRDAAGKSQLEFPIGKVLYATAGWLSHPRVSPSGDEIAVIEHPAVDDDGGYVLVVDRSGKTKKITGDFASILGLCWNPKGSEVWFTASRVGFNRFVHAVTLSGKVRVLAVATGGMTIEDVSRAGKVLLSQDKARQGMVAFGPGLEKERDLSWLDWSLAASLSKDGGTILFDESGEGGGAGYSVYARKMDGSPAIRLGEGSAQALSPDGKLALAIVHPSSEPKMVIYPIGSGDPKYLETPGLTVQAAAWLPDGRRLLLAANEQSRGVRIYVYDIGSQKSRAVTPEGYRFAASGAGVAPDGRVVAVFGPDRKPYLYPIEGGEPTALAIDAKWLPIGWSDEGGSMYVRQRGQTPAQINRFDLRTGALSPWRSLMPGDSAGVTTIGAIRITPDGKAYAYSFLRNLADLYVVEGLK